MLTSNQDQDVTLAVHNQEKLMVSWCKLLEHYEPE